MNTEITDDFIGIFDNFFTNDYIENYINYFEKMNQQGLTYDRQFSPKMEVDDLAVDEFTEPFFCKEMPVNYMARDFVNIFFDEQNGPYAQYIKKFSILRHQGKHSIYDIKVQKTSPGQGYHIWHVENSQLASRNRVTAFMLYLNDVEDGGETEFLYQKRRIKPKKNRLLIWPAHYTHVHRGLQPLSGDKYILTGWTEYSY
jgi:hypothetical protein